jgi:hypothetical protein
VGFRAGIAFTAALALAGAGRATADSAWSAYSNPAFHFSLDTPQPPSITTNTEKTDGGPMPTLQATVELDVDNALQITALDVSQIKPDPGADALLEGGVQGALKATDSTLDEQKSIMLGGIVGRVATYHSASVKFKTQLLYFNKSIVGITAAGQLSAPITPAFDQMAASVKFLP